MSNLYLLTLDLAKIAENMSRSEQRLIQLSEVEAWLEESGFERRGEEWLAEAVLVDNLRQEEIIDLRDAMSPAPVMQAPVMQAPVAPEPTVSEPPARFNAQFDMLRPPGKFVLDPVRRKELALMPDYDKLLIPEFLCGLHREVKRNSRRIAKRVIKDRSWQFAMSTESWIHVDDAPGVFQVMQNLVLSSEENVRLYVPIEEMKDVVFDLTNGEDKYQIIRDLFIDGISEFWFCLCVIGGSERWLPGRGHHRVGKGQAKCLHGGAGRGAENACTE